MKKNFISYQILIVSAILISLNIGCSKKNDTKKSPALVPIENFSKLDICGCNKQANIILDESLVIRKKFADKKTFKKNKNSVTQIRSYAKNWTKLKQACFRKHGSKMWMDSECNNLKIIEEKKDMLFNMGIQIDQGEKVKL